MRLTFNVFIENLINDVNLPETKKLEIILRYKHYITYFTNYKKTIKENEDYRWLKVI